MPAITVPCLWPESPFVVVGAGPSLTQVDLDLVHETVPRPRVIVVNNAYRLAPWADVLFAADAMWWRWQLGVPDADLPPLIYATQPTAVQWRPTVQLLQATRGTGLTLDPGKLVSGGHSGAQAINLAVHLGARVSRRIVLLGYDMQQAPDGRQHFHEDHPNGTHPTYAARLPGFCGLRTACDDLGITIVNCSPRTAIPHTVIPRCTLDAALRSCGGAAVVHATLRREPGDRDSSSPTARAGDRL